MTKEYRTVTVPSLIMIIIKHCSDLCNLNSYPVVYLFLSTNEIMSLEGGEIKVTVYILNSVMRDRDVEVNVTIDAGT